MIEIGPIQQYQVQEYRHKTLSACQLDGDILTPCYHCTDKKILYCSTGEIEGVLLEFQIRRKKSGDTNVVKFFPKGKKDKELLQREIREHLDRQNNLIGYNINWNAVEVRECGKFKKYLNMRFRNSKNK